MNIEVTSVDKEPEPYLQAPAAIQVITNDEIRRSGASSIPDALRLADGLDVAQENNHDWAISSRGFDSDLNKLLVLIDGRSVYTPLFSGVFWDEQDYLLEDIQQIEVINGPGGTLWGANAVNGVINITTKSAKDTQGFYMETGGGDHLRDFGGMRIGGTLAPNVYFRVYGKYFDDGSEVHGNGTSNANDSWKQGQAGFRIDAIPSTEDTYTLQGDYYGSNLNIDTGGDARANGGNVLGRWSHVFSDESNMSLQLYYDRTYLSDPIAALLLGSTPIAPSGILTDSLDTYDIDFQHHFELGGRNHVTWGLGYRYTQDVVRNTPSLGFLPPVLDQNLFSGFIQDEITVVKNVNFTLGTKIEHNDYTGFEFEPSARLQWNFASDQTLWGSVSRAVRTPSRIDRDAVEPTPPSPITLLQGNSDFVSETLIAYELGYRAKLGQKTTTSLSLYYNQYDNLRSTSTTPITTLPLSFSNNLQGYTYGLEFTVDHQLTDWWRLHAGYTLIEEYLWVKPGQQDLNNPLNEEADPQNQFSLRSSMDLPHNVEFDAGLRWVDKLHINSGSTPGTVPGYMELNVRLGWRATDWLEFSIVGENLLHDQHAEYGYPSPDREEIVRSVYGKVALRF